MTIKFESHNFSDIVELPERLSMAQASSIREGLHELVEQGHSNLILDLAKVNFMDSSGLSVLLSARKSVTQKNGQVVLLSPSAEARLLIELTRLNEVFDIFIDKEAAIDFFGQG